MNCYMRLGTSGNIYNQERKDGARAEGVELFDIQEHAAADTVHKKDEEVAGGAETKEGILHRQGNLL